jgi:hypothetical protein
VKDRTRNKRTAQHRGWVQSNTGLYRLYCNGIAIREIEFFSRPDKISVPPFGVKKWAKFLRGLGIDPTEWHTCTLVCCETGTMHWSERYIQTTPLDSRFAGLKIYTSPQVD